ncbi:MAG: Spo0B domain-containing protein [Syntrophomonas sp.]
MDAARAVELLRRIRHDYANHLQVISGYIELARYQEVKDYIAAMVEEMSEERKIFESLDYEAVVYLYEKMLSARDLGIILKYDELRISNTRILENHNEPDKTLSSLLARLGKLNNEPVVYLSLFEDGKELEMIFDCEYFGDMPIRIRIKE